MDITSQPMSPRRRMAIGLTLGDGEGFVGALAGDRRGRQLHVFIEIGEDQVVRDLVAASLWNPLLPLFVEVGNKP